MVHVLSALARLSVVAVALGVLQARVPCQVEVRAQLAVEASSQSAGCQPSWLPTFGQAPGVSGFVYSSVQAFTVFDDGSGPALFIGGWFTTAGGLTANSIARWNGTSWSALGSGMFDDFEGDTGSVSALAVFDDGSGPALYAGGGFPKAGGVTANSIAKWDGEDWSALGSGIGDGVISALAVFDDGSGPALYVGGKFSTAGGLAANSIARWDGSSWSTLGSGMRLGAALGSVSGLAVFDDGSGPALYAGGLFGTAGGVPANSIARWDGTSWSALASEVDAAVHVLTVFDDGSGPALYAGGEFTGAGGVAAESIAKWNGTSWSALGVGMGGTTSWVNDLTVLDDGSGAALYAGGYFDSAGGIPAFKLAKWNGTSWSALGGGVLSSPEGYVPSAHALMAFDDGSGPALYVGGYFTGAGAVTVNLVAKWKASTWSMLGNGLDLYVQSLTVFDDGHGPALFASGFFTIAKGKPVNHIARWNGSGWSKLGDGLNNTALCLADCDDGSGPALYASGPFTSAGGVAVNSIARWNGSTWSALGSGLNNSALCLATFDDGSGPALYAGGFFSTAGGVAANHIAKWNGTSWSALGSGMNSTVYALTVFDDGSGPALYAGGGFTIAGGVPAKGIAKWNGSAWSALGSELSGSAEALTVFDDGGGPALYAVGYFTTAGGVAANHIAKWNGSSWSPLGSGMGGGFRGGPALGALAVLDDGSGPALYAGGDFITAGGATANGIAKWDGSSWSALGSGMSSPSVWDLAVFDDGSGPALYAGGFFSSALDSGDAFLAKWGGCPASPPTWTDLGSGLAGVSGSPHLTGLGTLEVGSAGSLGLTKAAPSSAAMLFGSPASTPTPFKGGTLVPVPVLLSLLLSTDPLGELLIPWTAWPPGLSGLSLYFQYAIKDSVAVKGVALSNALSADVP